MKCPNCGTEVNAEQNSNYQPISMWGYFGYELLFSLPVIGFICLIIFSVGGSQNVNVKNFARSYFCLAILGIVVTVLFFVVVGGTAGLYQYIAENS